MKKLILGMVVLMVAVSAQAVIIDNFDADTLDAAWVQTDWQTNRGAATQVMTDGGINPDGLNFLTPNSGDASKNVTFLLRNDETLDVGETLLTVPLRAKNNTYTGLFITGSTSPADRANSLWIQQTPTTGDNGIGSLDVVAINGADLGANETIGSTGYSFDTYTVLKQYITRLTTTTYEAGYIDGSGAHAVLTTTIDAGTAGAAIGYYVDMRAYQWTSYDDFEIVPEPATMGLLGLGSLLAIRRKK